MTVSPSAVIYLFYGQTYSTELCGKDPDLHIGKSLSLGAQTVQETGTIVEKVRDLMRYRELHEGNNNVLIKLSYLGITLCLIRTFPRSPVLDD